MKLLIVADDLTGALDTAAQISKRGVKTLVIRCDAAAPVSAAAENCEALCINLDMRHDAPTAAFRKVSDLLRRFGHIPHIYLKTDSVLRGNLSAAFAAALAEIGGTIMFIPAYPKSGRVTIGGEQFVCGEKLEHSPFAQDPRNPMRTSSISDILNKDYPMPRDGVIIFDCETQEQLLQIGSRLHAQNALRMTAGCAGFAEILCGCIEFEREYADFTPHDGPVLFLSGSANKFTFDQLARAKECGLPVVKIPPLDLTLPDKFLEENKSVVLTTAETHDDLVGTPPDFAGIASRFVRSGGRNLAIFGGDTAMAVLRELDCNSLRPLAEIQPGIPLCVAGGLNLATKSGGLGDLNAVADIEKYLRGK